MAQRRLDRAKHRRPRFISQLPDLADNAAKLANRLTPLQALENLKVIERTRRMLETNVQEALAIEVGLLKLNL